MQMTEFIRAFPQAAPVVGDILARNLDWPGADEIAKRLEKINPTNQPQIPPELQQQIQEGQQAIAELTNQVESLKAGHDIKMFDAETNRMKVEGDQKINKAELGVDLLRQAAEPEPATNPTR